MVLNRLSGSSWLRAFVVPVLVGALAFPHVVFAPPVPVHQLGTKDDAVTFANDLMATLPPEGDREVHLFHVEGHAPDARLKVILQVLAQGNVKVKGTFVTKQRFEEIIAKYDDDGETGAALDRHLLAFQKQLEAGTPAAPGGKGWFSWLRPKTLYGSLTKLKEKIFGLPQGFFFFVHFYSKGADGKWHWRFPFDWPTFQLAATTSVLAIANITAVRTLGPLFAAMLGMDSEPAKPMDAEFWAINAVVFVFVFACLFLQRELLSFKSQGASVRVDASAPEGEQIRTEANSAFFLASSFGQEAALNGLITGTVSLMSGFPGVGAVLHGLLNGFLAAFAYAAPEALRAQWLAEAERVKHTDPKRAEALASRSWWLAMGFWNAVFPTFKNMNFFLQSWLAFLPFVVLGGLGLGVKTVKTAYQGIFAAGANAAMASRAIPESELPRGCPALLVVKRGDEVPARP